MGTFTKYTSSSDYFKEFIYFNNADLPSAPSWQNARLNDTKEFLFNESQHILVQSRNMVSTTSFGSVGPTFPTWVGADNVYDFNDGSFLSLAGPFTSFIITPISSTLLYVIDGSPDAAGDIELYYSIDWIPPEAFAVNLGFWRNKVKSEEYFSFPEGSSFFVYTSRGSLIDYFYVDVTQITNFTFQVSPDPDEYSITAYADICAYVPGQDPNTGYNNGDFYSYIEEAQMNMSITFLNTQIGRYYFLVNCDEVDKTYTVSVSYF